MRPSLACAVALLFACSKNDPTTQTKSVASTEPIPTDIVYNSMFEDKAASAKVMAVGDGGMTPTPNNGAGPSNVRLDNAGADPKSPILYAFANKTRTVSATIKISQAGGPGGAAVEQPFKFTFTVTPKPKGLAGDATMDIKGTSFDLTLPPNAPPSSKDAAQKAFMGIVGHMDATSHGELGEPKFEGSENAAELVTVLQQSLDLLVVPFPAEPIGLGAKWTKSESRRLADEGLSMSGTMTMTLTARDDKTASIKVEGKSSGSQSVKDPRAPKGTTMQRSAISTYTIIVRLDGVAQKADGETKNDIIQKVPGQPDQAISAKVTQTIESK